MIRALFSHAVWLFLVVSPSVVYSQKTTTINLPVYDLKGNVKTISGFEFGPNGGEKVFQLSLGANPTNNEVALAPSELRETPLLSLINHPSVAEELSLTGDQQEMIAEVNEFWSSRATILAKEIRFGVDGSSDSSQIADQIRANSARQDEELLKVLVPHQIGRLKQIAFQSIVSIHGLMGVLSSPRFKGEFELDDQQLTSLRKRFTDIEDELKADIEKLKMEAREKMIKELSPKQRSKFNEMFGEAFQINEADWKKTK